MASSDAAHKGRQALWLCIQPLLSTFAKKMAAADPTLTCRVSSSSNAAFLLRAYASLLKSKDGEEIAITVDATATDDLVTLSSDVCMDSGEVLAEVPTAMVELSVMSGTPEGALSKWIKDFEKFLSSVEPTVRLKASTLR